MYRVPAYRVALVREGSVIMTERPRMAHAGDVAKAFSKAMRSDELTVEEFWVAMLDIKNRVIGMHRVSTGSLSTSLVHPREVFKPAILMNAAAVVVAHNHPSGEPVPSREDREITGRLAECGKMLGIPVMDHVVLGVGGSMFSFSEAGLLTT